MKDYQLFGMGLIITFFLFILLIVYSTMKTVEVYDLQKENRTLIIELNKRRDILYFQNSML